MGGPVRARAHSVRARAFTLPLIALFARARQGRLPELRRDAVFVAAAMLVLLGAAAFVEVHLTDQLVISAIGGDFRNF